MAAPGERPNTNGVRVVPTSPTVEHATIQGRPTSRAAAAGSAAVALVAVVGGDAAMAGVAAAARATMPGPTAFAWCAAAAVIAASSYAFVGVPQLALGRRQAGDGDVRDRRSRFAVRLLDGGPDRKRTAASATTAFVVASVVAGPLAIGWFAGRHQLPQAHRRTAVSAAVFGAVWAAVYLGAIAAAF